MSDKMEMSDKMNTLYNSMITPPRPFPKVGPNSPWGINEDGFNKVVNERDATTEAKKPVMIIINR